MSLLKSFFCVQGDDNPLRYLLISAVLPFVFVLLFLLLEQSIIVGILLSILFSATHALSTLRRAKNAGTNAKWIWIGTLSLFTAMVTLIITAPDLFYPVSFLPIVFALPLFLQTSKTNHNFIWGYTGPIDLSQYQQQYSTVDRIEPKFAGAISDSIDEQILHSQQSVNSDSNSHLNNTQTSINYREHLATWVSWLKSRIKLVSIVLTLLIITLATVMMFTKTQTMTPPENEHSYSKQEVVAHSTNSERLHQVDMPDNFSIYTNEHKGIYIHWQADEVENKLLWSQSTTLGDNSCQAIAFNNGNTFRTLEVSVEKRDNYFAYFSPLDTQKLLQSIALKARFKLCGYEFSLKGSQSALGKVPHYAQFIEY